MHFVKYIDVTERRPGKGTGDESLWFMSISGFEIFMFPVWSFLCAMVHEFRELSIKRLSLYSYIPTFHDGFIFSVRHRLHVVASNRYRFVIFVAIRRLFVQMCDQQCCILVIPYRRHRPWIRLFYRLKRSLQRSPTGYQNHIIGLYQSSISHLAFFRRSQSPRKWGRTCCWKQVLSVCPHFPASGNQTRTQHPGSIVVVLVPGCWIHGDNWWI